MTKDIAKHIEECTTCQHRRQQHHQKDEIISPLPLCTQPNQRVHVDLFGPLKTEIGKKMVICFTDAFTKYAEITAFENKEADTVAQAIFDHWICRQRCPALLLSGQGKEFCNQVLDKLCALMSITKKKDLNLPSSMQQPKWK
jgi:hypothetical protein